MELEDFGQAVSHRSRVAILTALLGGKALPASELAYRARISGQTASSHLAILKDLKVVNVRKCGRHRYFELSNSDIAEAIETLASKLELGIRAPKKVDDHLRSARFCYDHLAGKLGTAITDVLIRTNILTVTHDSFQITESNHAILKFLEIDVGSVRAERRQTSPRCIDWSERRPHVAGSFGAAIAAALEAKSFIKRSRDDRSVAITLSGYQFLEQYLHIPREFFTTENFDT